MKVAITGANKGIGHAIVLKLLADPKVSQVCFTAQQRSSATEALKDFNAISKGKKVDFLPLEILPPGSVDKFIKAAKEGQFQFDAFLHNAGVFLQGLKQETLDSQFRINYSFPVELTHALIKYGIVKKGGRFVYSSSGMGNIDEVKGNPEAVKLLKKYKSPEVTEKVVEQLAKRYQAEVMDPSKGWGDNLYAHSKMFLTLHVNALAKTYKDYYFFAACPGFMATTMTKGMGATRTPAEGAETAAYLTTASLGPEVNGEFFKDKKLSTIVW